MGQLRDDAERLIRSWDAYERGRGTDPIIDFDCHPDHQAIEPLSSRREALDQVEELVHRARMDQQSWIVERLLADRAYLLSLLGERIPLVDYLAATQGTTGEGWGNQYLAERLENVKVMLTSFGVAWDAHSLAHLDESEGPIQAADAPDAIREAAASLEPQVRFLADSQAPFELRIEAADVDAYWAYWLDGSGSSVRLRLNQRSLSMTKVRARQFALHEVLGHGLQYASLSARAGADDVPWVRLLSVHAPHQVLFEGLASAMSLFAQPHDQELKLRTYIDHYTQLVRAQLHLAVNAGTPLGECFDRARRLVPFWTDDQIGNVLSDRSVSPLLRSYLWSYPAGLDWFIRLSEAAPDLADKVIRAAYREPLTPSRLQALWPAGPTIGQP